MSIFDKNGASIGQVNALIAANLDEFSVVTYGATGNGTTDDLASIQAAIDAAPDGKTVYLPSGNYRVNGSINLINRDIRLVGPSSARILQGASGPVIVATSGPVWFTGSSGLANSMVTTTTQDGQTTLASVVTLTSAQTLVQGDAVKVYSSDVIPGSKASGVSGKARRMGECAIVSAPTHETGPTSTTSVNLSSVLYESDQYTTGIMVSKFSTRKLVLSGFSVGTVGEPTPGAWNTGNEPYISVQGYYQPVIENIRGDGLYGAFIRPIGCFQARIHNCVANDLRNEPQYNRFGYCVDDQSQGTVVSGLRGTNNRHLYTTNSPTSYVTGTDGAHPEYYGRTMHCTVSDSIAIGCSNAGFDTHEEAAYVSFDSCRTVGSFRGNSSSSAGFSIRGRYSVIRNCDSDACKNGAVVYSDVLGSNTDALIDNCRFRNCTLYGVYSATGGTATGVGTVTIRDVTVTLAPNTPGRLVAPFYFEGATATFEGINRGTLTGSIDTNSYGLYCGAGTISPYTGTAYVIAPNSSLILDISGQTATGGATVSPVFIGDGCTLTALQSRSQGLRGIYGAISNGGAFFAGTNGASKGSFNVLGVSADINPTWYSGVTATGIGYASDVTAGGASTMVNQTITTADTLSLGGVNDPAFLLNITLSGTQGQTFTLPNPLPAGAFRGQVAYISVVSASNNERLVIQHGSGSFAALLPNSQALCLGVYQTVKAIWNSTAWVFGNETRQSSTQSISSATIIGAAQDLQLTLTGTSTYAVTLPPIASMPGGKITWNKTGTSGIVSLTTVNSETINGSTAALAVSGTTTGQLIATSAGWVTVAKGPIVATISSSTTVPSNADIVFWSGTNSLTLPSSRVGKILTIKKTDAGTTGTLVGTIDGSTTHTMVTQYGSVTLTGDGTNWYSIGSVAGGLAAI